MKGLRAIILVLILISCVYGVYGEEMRGLRHGDFELYSGTDISVFYEPGYVAITPADRNEILYIFTHMFGTTEELMQAFSVLVEAKLDTPIQKAYGHVNEEDWLLAWTPQSGYMYTKFV